MMDSRQRADLDRYITGNYGENQFRESRRGIGGKDICWHCAKVKRYIKDKSGLCSQCLRKGVTPEDEL